MSEYVLKPCPFCGNKNIAEDEGCFPSGDGFEVRCGNPFCYAHEPQQATFAEAIEVWNTRAAAAPREPAPAIIDGCTESNCPRCMTAPYARGNMKHAGIGGYPPEPAVGGDLPDWLLELMANYGLACDGRRKDEALHHWQELIRGIKRYAAAAPREPAPDERVQHSEWGPMPDAGTQADAPFVPFYQLLQSPHVWADIDQETFIEMKGVNCRVLYGVKP